MNGLKVSIILATYNRAHFLDAAIESVRRQSFQDWELVISDDASTDDTAEKVKEWQKKDPRIVYRRNEKNLGIAGNYNAAFQAARGEYLAMLDDDDYWVADDKVERQVRFLDENFDHVGVGGGMAVLDALGKEAFRYLKPETDAAIRRSMFFSNPMANSTTLFRRSAAEQLGWYNASIEHGADRDFWLRMGRIGKLYNFQDYFSSYTLGGQNALLRAQRVMFRCILRFIKQYKNDYPHYRAGMVFNYGAYVYSFLPASLRAFANRTLFYFKHLLFDRVRVARKK